MRSTSLNRCLRNYRYQQGVGNSCFTIFAHLRLLAAIPSAIITFRSLRYGPAPLHYFLPISSMFLSYRNIPVVFSTILVIRDTLFISGEDGKLEVEGSRYTQYTQPAPNGGAQS